jgi:hypothetical protein
MFVLMSKYCIEPILSIFTIKEVITFIILQYLSCSFPGAMRRAVGMSDSADQI